MARRKVMTELLPSIPCTPEMRAQVVEVADRHGVSMADIVRDAITLFLSDFDSIASNSASTADKEPAST